MRRWILCAVCALAAAVLYIFTRTAPSLLLLSAAVFIPAASVLLVILGASGVSVSLEVPASLQKGVPTRAALIIENRSIIPVVHIGLTLTIRNSLTGQERRIPLGFSAAPRHRCKMYFDFESSYCGQFRFTCGELLICDLLRLCRVRKVMSAQTKRLVPPETFMPQITLLGSDVSPEGNESFSVDRRGQDHTEPFQIRDYAEGDSIRNIHWKLSNKLDRFIVTDPSLELERSLLLFWDSGALPEDAPPEVPDALAEAFVSICLMLTEGDVPYSIAWENADTGDVAIKDVYVVDDIYDAIPEILHAGTGGTRHSMITEFMQAAGMRRFPTIAYFAGQVPAELDVLAQIGRITVFLCSTDAGADDDGAHHYQVFSPANYTSILRNVTI